MESAYALYFEYTSEGLFSQYFDQKNLLTGCLYFCKTSCISLAASNKAWLKEFKTKTQYQKTSHTREATSFLYP